MEELNTGGALLFQSFIDDGAVFYLNGVEIHRLRMPIDFTAMTVATGYPCAGNANCPDEFKIPYATMPSLRTGTNILAVEVHNYNERSNDITFGMALQRIDPQESANLPVMNVTLDGNSIRITWEGGATVESADNPKGPWTELGTFQNALTVQLGTGEQFYRLKR
jgi:hypothetical protein